MRDYYEILGIPKTASEAEIKKAWRTMATRNHPDKNVGKAKMEIDLAEARFKEAKEAYDVLSDPSKRAMYDQHGHKKNPFEGAQRHTPEDFGQAFNFRFGEDGRPDLDEIFRQFRQFGMNQGGFTRRSQTKNNDLRIALSITLAETLTQQKRTLKVHLTRPVPPNGEPSQTVEVEIPRGVQPGTTIKYTGMGDNVQEHLPRGDLYVQLHVLPDERFEVHNLDLVSRININCFEAVVGLEKEITGLDGAVYSVKIPAGTQPGTKFALRGQGLFMMGQNARGSLIIDVNIQVPKDLTAEQLELVKKLVASN